MFDLHVPNSYTVTVTVSVSLCVLNKREALKERNTDI